MVGVRALGAVALTLAALGANPAAPDEARAPDGPASLSTAGHEMFASRSATDWATGADHVAEVGAVSDRLGQEAYPFMGRVALMRVIRVHWSRPGAPALPDEFESEFHGYWITDSGLRPAGMLGSSRGEPGHRYLMGVRLLEPRCNPDDGVDPGGWAALGSGAVVPMDGGRLGFGEYEGEVQRVGQPPGMAGTLLGRAESLGVDGIVERVAAASQTPRQVQRGERVGC